MFSKFQLDVEDDFFNKLSIASEFEQVGKYRLNAIIVCLDTNGHIPIVRTTTCYEKSSQLFKTIHQEIVEKIIEFVPDFKVNNAMVEIYDSTCTTMKYHSDQALDLAEDSYICIFSVYEYKNEKFPRKLKVKEKNKDKSISEIILHHNSAVIFSTCTNEKYVHKIISEGKTKSKWCGITFRLSKTFIYKINNVEYFVKNGKMLTIANEYEKKEFFKHKNLENVQIGYRYPEISYTLSRH